MFRGPPIFEGRAARGETINGQVAHLFQTCPFAALDARSHAFDCNKRRERSMNIMRAETKDVVKSVAVSAMPEGLAAIHRPNCAAAIWDRAPLESFQSWIDQVPANTLPQTRTILQPGAVRRAMYQLVEASGLEGTAERAMLVDDVAALADIFADLTQAPYLRLRLEVVTTNACRRFHIDAVTSRLVCTYRGTGTQYGLADDMREVEAINTVPTGSPILLRGTLWPVTPKSDLLHRSPPIEGTGEARLLLVLDPITELENAEKQHLLH